MEPKVTQDGRDDKFRLREAQRHRLASLTEDRKNAENSWLNSALKEWVPSRGFEVILTTLPMSDEPDLTPFLKSWLAAGHTVALARTGPGRGLTFHYIGDLEGPWEIKFGGIREPRAEASWTPGPLTLCLVPGLAFTRAADRVARLGRGGGYYDRWLSVFAPSVFTLGVGFSVQAVDTLPTEAHDLTLDDCILPGAGVRRSGKARPANSKPD